MTILALALHILGAIVWVGGMFAIYMCLRPALGTLKPPHRLRLMRVTSPEKKHRVAVTRALRQMELPPLWRTVRLNRSGAEHCLYNADNVVSFGRATKRHLGNLP